MTRKEIVIKMEEVFSKGLQAAMIVFRSPLTNSLEERHIYADSCMEVMVWATAEEKYYREKDIPFGIWVNNHIEVNYKFEITEEDCKDE